MNDEVNAGIEDELLSALVKLRPVRRGVMAVAGSAFVFVITMSRSRLSCTGSRGEEPNLSFNSRSSVSARMRPARSLARASISRASLNFTSSNSDIWVSSRIGLHRILIRHDFLHRKSDRQGIAGKSTFVLRYNTKVPSKLSSFVQYE